MRLPHRIDKILITLSSISIFAVFACLIHFFVNKNVFADNDPLENLTEESAEVESETACDFSETCSSESDSDSREFYVNFYDDGEKLIVKTSAKTVREALARAKITLSASDSVEPALDSEITSDNFHINIYRARPVLLIDGIKKLYFETAASDPAEIFRAAGITVYDGDEIEIVKNSDFLETGVAVAYEIIRGDGQTVTIEEEIPFSEKTVIDYNLAVGVSKVEQLGEVGRKKLVYQVLSVDGVEISRELISETVLSNPVDRVTTVGGKLSSETSTSENEAIIWNFLKSQGFSSVQTAGIMGNLKQEHHFQTSDSSGGLGIAQWTGGRRNALLAKENPYNIYTQLEYLMSELNGGYQKVQTALRSATTIEEAVQIFQNQFERCGICREEKRIEFANEIYSRYAVE